MGSNVYRVTSHGILIRERYCLLMMGALQGRALLGCKSNSPELLSYLGTITGPHTLIC